MDEFKPIKDFETYAVNKKGEVKDLRSKKLLKQYPNPYNGNYKGVNLINENGDCKKAVHRLVGLTFIPNPDNLPEIDHIDRDRHNNNVDNLRWVSRSDNQINKLFKTSKYPKCILLEDLKSKKNPNPSWIINIRNKKCQYRKRFQYANYTLEQITEIRNKVFTEHGIDIID